MPTLASLRVKIADDLHRGDLDTQISDAITNAIRRYNRERLWFLEGTATLTLAASTSSYDLPTDFRAVDSVLLNTSGRLYPLDQVSYNEIDSEDDGTFTGDPSQYAIYGKKIRFYPTPQSANSTVVSYLKALDEPSAAGSNSWTEEGYDLIRYAAEKELYRNVLRNPEMAQMSYDGEREAFQSLTVEHIQRTSTGRLVKSGF